VHTLQFQKSIASNTTTATVWAKGETSWEKIGRAYGEYIVVGEEPTEDVDCDGCGAEDIQAEQRGRVCRLEWGQDDKRARTVRWTCLNMPAMPVTVSRGRGQREGAYQTLRRSGWWRAVVVCAL
jgi:hypothetical protein